MASRYLLSFRTCGRWSATRYSAPRWWYVCSSFLFFFSSRRRHTRYWRDWSSDVCSSDLILHQIDGAVGVAPFVVVPAEHLDAAAVGHGEGGVEDAASRVADDVAGDYGRVGVLEDPGELAPGGLPEGVVDLLNRGLPRGLGHEVRDRAVGYGHAHRHAVHLALELGVDHTRRPRRARRGRDDVVRRAPRPPGVLVRRIQQALVVGVGRAHV